MSLDAQEGLGELGELGVEVVEEQEAQQSYVLDRLRREVALQGFDGTALPVLTQAQLAVFSPSVVRAVLHSMRRRGEARDMAEQRKQRMQQMFLRSLLAGNDALSDGEDGADDGIQEDVAEEGVDALVSAVVAREARNSRQLEDGEVLDDDDVDDDDNGNGNDAEQPMHILPVVMPDAGADLPKVSSVQCPICNEIIQVREGASVDHVLDQHIERCGRRHARHEQAQRMPATEAAESDEFDDEDYVEEQLEDLVMATDRPTSNRKRKVAADVIVEAYRWDDFDDVRFAERIEQLPEDHPITLENGHVVDETIYNQLQPHQQQGLAWLWGLHTQHVGGILADEMGLGKTAQICVHCDCIRRARPKTQFLIVTPATVLRHWEKEFHRWAPNIRVLVFHPINPTFKVIASLGLVGLDRALARVTDQQTPTAVIVSYEGMKRYQDVLLAYEWSAAVLDEGQKIRNPDANITVVCKQIPASHRIIASGTPIQNSLRELWSLFDFAYPSKLGPLRLFELDFVEPLRVGGYRNATPLEARVAVHTAQTLQALLRPYMLRRKKKDISMHTTLPKKTEQVLFCKLTPLQRDIYKQILGSDEVQALLRKGARLTAFRSITTLRKLCNHPSFVYQNGNIKWSENDKNDQQDEEVANSDLTSWRWADSGKLVVLKRVLTMWIANQHRSLIFSQTRILLNVIEEMCRQEGWTYLRMDGTTSMGKRQSMIDTFNQDASIPLMLLTTRTGGLGISLTGADRVVLVDPDWNPQTDIQARERAWRIGQTKPVTIFRLITRGTIEEKIYQRQIFKTLLSNQVLDNPKQQRLFSRQYLRELFELQEVADEHVGVDVQLPDQGVLYKSEVVQQGAAEQSGNHSADAEDEEEATASGSKQEGMVLAALFSGNDVAAVFQHDCLEGEPGVVNGVPTTAIDAEARRRVQEAVQSLQRPAPQPQQAQAPTTQQPVFSSSSLLRAIRAPAASSAATTSSEVVLAKRIVQILKDNGPLPSARLLRHFQDMRDQDAPMFREILHSVATLRQKSWHLNELFQAV